MQRGNVIASQSNHAMIYLELCFPNLVHRPKKMMGEEKSKMKIDYNILRAGGASRFKEEIASFVTHLEQELIEQENEQSPDELLNCFQDFITQSAKKSLNARSRIDQTGFLVLRQNCYIIVGSKMKPSRNIWKKGTKPPYMHYDEPEPTSNA